MKVWHISWYLGSIKDYKAFNDLHFAHAHLTKVTMKPTREIVNFGRAGRHRTKTLQNHFEIFKNCFSYKIPFRILRIFKDLIFIFFHSFSPFSDFFLFV